MENLNGNIQFKIIMNTCSKGILLSMYTFTPVQCLHLSHITINYSQCAFCTANNCIDKINGDLKTRNR